MGPMIGGRPSVSVDSVVYATDFSVFCQNAGLYAAVLARHFDARLLVAHAFTLSQAAMEVEIDHALVSRQRMDLELLLSSKAEALSEGVLQAVPVLLDGDPITAVPDLAEKMKPAVVVLGTHGIGWIERGLIGSVAEGILRRSPWPTITIGPQARAPSDTFPFRRILYVTDFSSAAARAAQFAVGFAQAMSADIDVLNVISADDVEHPENMRELQERFYTALDHVVPEQAKEFCNPRTFVAVGKAREEVLKHLAERSIDLLVLGVRRFSYLGFEMRAPGALQLILDAKCPVLTVAT